MPRPPGQTGGVVEFLYNPYQVAFLEALQAVTAEGRWAYRNFVLLAGRRGGKTKVGGLAAVQKAQRPGTVGWVCAPTYPDLHDFVMPAFFACLPEAWIADWSAAFFTLTLRNGSRVAFRSLDDPERARGPGLDWVWIDEARKVSEAAWDTMLPALTDRAGQAFLTSTPNGMDWVYRRFYQPAIEGVPGFWACRYRTVDNPAIDREEVERARRQLDPRFFAQEYEADFVSFAGAVYGTAVAPVLLGSDEAVQRVLPEWPRIDPSRPCLLGVDPGADHPFAAVLLVATPQGLVVVGEYRERHRPIVEHLRGIRALLEGRTGGRPLIPSMIGIDRSQRQWIIELAQHGFYTQPAENNVVAGIQRVHAWLASGQFWIVEAACPKLKQELLNYQWAENERPDGQRTRELVRKADDDLCDALRYALMLWPELPTAASQTEPDARLLELDPDSRWRVERLRRTERTATPPETVHPWVGEGDGWGDADDGGLGDFWR